MEQFAGRRELARKGVFEGREWKIARCGRVTH